MATAQKCVDLAALCWIEAHPGLAAWLQALFSVLAIVVAIIAPITLSAIERRRRQVQLRRQALNAAGMVSAAIEVFATSAADQERRQVFGEVGGYPSHIFDSAKLALAQLDIGSIEDESVSRAVHMLAMHLQASENDVGDFAHFASDDEGGDQWASHIAKRARDAEALYMTIKGSLA